MIKIPDLFVDQVRNILDNAKKILLVAHKNPDGDTLGSVFGLCEVLSKKGKVCHPVCVDPMPYNLMFLPFADRLKNDFTLADYDTVIICDTAAIKMSGFEEKHPELFDKSTGIPIINIDHHGTNENYGTANLVVTEAASTTVLLTKVLLKLGWEFCPKVATAFLTGIYTDTGSLMHSNTDAFTMRVAASLVARGANLRVIRKEIFKTTKISTLKIWGKVMSNIYKNEEGVTVSVVTEEDFQETGADYSEMSGVINYVNSVPNSNFSVILTERDGKVKGSLRTMKNDVNLSDIAGQFGGGGHPKASGFTIPGRLEKEVRWNVVN